MNNAIEIIGVAASFIMPLFNIPMMMHIIKRKSSNDISLVWVVGVWACILFMFPATLISTDLAFKVFGIMNITLFSAVLLITLKFRHKKVKPPY